MNVLFFPLNIYRRKACFFIYTQSSLSAMSPIDLSSFILFRVRINENNPYIYILLYLSQRFKLKYFLKTSQRKLHGCVVNYIELMYDVNLLLIRDGIDTSYHFNRAVFMVNKSWPISEYVLLSGKMATCSNYLSQKLIDIRSHHFYRAL